MDILKLFKYEERLSFTDIQNALKVRSNKLAYHLNNLTKKGILIKEDKFYLLSKTSENIIPFLSEKGFVLPTILIHMGNSKEAFLIKRNKRPFKSMLGLPGGKILIGESFEKAVSRIMREKYSINTKLNKIHSASLEHIKDIQSKVINSFLLIFVSATTNEKVILTNLQKARKQIITSDYFLIKNDLNKKIDIKTIETRKF